MKITEIIEDTEQAPVAKSNARADMENPVADVQQLAQFFSDALGSREQTQSTSFQGDSPASKAEAVEPVRASKPIQMTTASKSTSAPKSTTTPKSSAPADDHGAAVTSVHDCDSSNNSSGWRFAPVTGEAATLFPSVYGEKEVKASLAKWDVLDQMQICSFSYDNYLAEHQHGDFLHALFASQTVQQRMQRLLGRHTWQSWAADGVLIAEDRVRPVFCRVPSSQTNLGFFDRVHAAGVVRDNGSLVRQLDQHVGDFVVADKLRVMLLRADEDEDGELSDLYDNEERSEFLFRILQHCALGGGLNQFEDSLKPYLDAVRALYKANVSVSTAAPGSTAPIRVTSSTYAIQSISPDLQLWPSKGSPQNWLYVTIDPIRRRVVLWYHAFMSW